MPPIPFMFLSDSVDCKSGLARITRDLAVHTARLPEFRVATLGRGGRATSKIPFHQYVMSDKDWGESYLEECWMDFAGNERGVLMSIWDPSRVRYLVSKEGLPNHLTSFLDSGRFERWLYCTVDATGPNNRLTGILADTIQKFDRVVAYGMWAQDLITRSTGRQDVDWLPHGINFKAFQPRDKDGARLAMGISLRDTVIGCVMTNQTRKDWGLVCVVADQIRKLRPGVKFWFHVDEPIRHWNLYALMQDYGLMDVVKLTQTGTMSDRELSWWYSGCDVTILPSSEGFGYAIPESLACGTAVIHSRYAGGAELVPNGDWLVGPQGYRLDGVYNCLRPTWDPQDWVNAVVGYLDGGRWSPEECRRSVSHLDWTSLWEPWKKWMLAGVGVSQGLRVEKSNTGAVAVEDAARVGR